MNSCLMGTKPVDKILGLPEADHVQDSFIIDIDTHFLEGAEQDFVHRRHVNVSLQRFVFSIIDVNLGLHVHIRRVDGSSASAKFSDIHSWT